MNARTIVAIVLGVVSVACAAGVFEQSHSGQPSIVEEPLDDATPHAQLQGIIRDRETGEAIEGALIVVQCSCLTKARESSSTSAGAFVFRDLPPGTYTVQVLKGVGDVARTVEVPAGMRVRVDVRLEPGRMRVLT